MTKDELIEKLTSEDIPISVFGVDVDPLVVEGKLNLILKYLKEGDSRGTDVMVNGAYQEIINFISDPQAQLDALDGLIDSLDATKADNAQVQSLVNQVATLNADKQNFATDKHAGNLNVGTMQEFRDYFYELRKSPTRNYQYEVSSSTNLDLMDILGWPNGNGKEAFIYVNLPYSEAGGFEIDVTYMERNGSPIYKRTMTGTLNANWKDTNWVQYVSKTEVNNLSMCPSNTIDNNIFPNPTTWPKAFYDVIVNFNGYISISYNGDSSSMLESVDSIRACGVKYGDYYRLSIPCSKGNKVRLFLLNKSVVQSFTSTLTHTKEV